MGYSIIFMGETKMRLRNVKGKEEIISISIRFPALYSYSITGIKQKIKELTKLGYTKEEVIKMTIQFPGIYSASKEKLIEKIKYFQERYLNIIVLNDTKQLMQSLELTHARYEFFKEENIQIDQKNYKKLFYNNNTFEKQYKITKQELLEKYNYKTYLNEQEKILKLK